LPLLVVLSMAIRPPAVLGVGACGPMDPGHEARDDSGGLAGGRSGGVPLSHGVSVHPHNVMAAREAAIQEDEFRNWRLGSGGPSHARP
jgi:hypothetical protein